jgi:DNA polymerase-1
MVLEEFGVTPKNFLTHKILLGDAGDNVPGVKGLGAKTLLKIVPELSTNEAISLDDVLGKCDGSKKIMQGILNFEHQLRINKQLMDLRDPNIPEDGIEEIKSVLLKPNKGFSSQDFISLYKEDDLNNSIPNLQMWLFSSFNELTKYK